MKGEPDTTLEPGGTFEIRSHTIERGRQFIDFPAVLLDMDARGQSACPDQLGSDVREDPLS